LVGQFENSLRSEGSSIFTVVNDDDVLATKNRSFLLRIPRNISLFVALSSAFDSLLVKINFFVSDLVSIVVDWLLEIA
jgi:hypothetical protein